MDHVKHNSNKQLGFSLIEILIALAMLTAITQLMASAFVPWMNYKQRIETESRLKQIGNELHDLYKQNAFNIDDWGADGLHLQNNKTFISGTISPIDDGYVCNSSDANWSIIQPWVNSSVTVSSRDGYNNPVCVLISPNLSQIIEGVRINYRDIMIISAGKNSVLDEDYSVAMKTVTTNATTGNVTVEHPQLKGDDQVYYIDGFKLEYDNYLATIKKMKKIAEIFENYFTFRYLATTTRDTTIDYFGCLTSSSSKWDYNSACGTADNGVLIPKSTQNTVHPIKDIKQQLGLDDSMLTTEWEPLAGTDGAANQTNLISYNNSDYCGYASVGEAICARSPDINVSAPYTTVIFARLPGAAITPSPSGDTGQYIFKIATGNY